MSQSFITLKDVSKTPAGSKEPILKNISLEIAKGKKVSILGRSGSGKTSLMNIIGLMDRPSTGTYLLADKDTSQFDDLTLSSTRGQTMGYVFQSFHLLSNLSLMENLLLPQRYYRGPKIENIDEHARSLLKEVGLEHRIKTKVSVLSGGEKQRLAIARALINKPKVLLADEPTGALDSRTRDLIMQLFAKVHEDYGLTTIMVTHDQEIASFGHMMISLLDGQIKEIKSS